MRDEIIELARRQMAEREQQPLTADQERALVLFGLPEARPLPKAA